MQLVGDKHVIAEHFKPQCNIGTDLPRVLQDTSIIRPSIISSKEQLPIAKNVLTPLTSNDITSVTSNKEQVENSSIPGSSVMTRQEQLVISNIPGDSPADKFTTQEEQPRNEPEDESSLPGSSKQQMGRNYSCDECDYVAKLLHHLRVILFDYVHQCFSYQIVGPLLNATRGL